MGTETDRELVEAASRGDRQAFDELVRRHQSAIVNLVRAMIGRDGEAEDLAQEAFVRAWKSLAQFRGDSTFRTWLHGIAMNVVRTQRSRAWRVRQLFAGAAGERAARIEPASQDDGIENPLAMRDAIDRALGQLPADLREAVVLRDLQGLEYRDIADVLGIAVGTVESRIFRARRRLRPLLESVRDQR